MASQYSTFRNILFILLFWAYPTALLAVKPPIPAHPSQYVVDLAGVLDAGVRARLNDMLRDLEAKTTAQVVVLTIDSLERESIESFSHQTAVKWGIGQKGKDNGVLLTVAVKDRKYRIEVGYGLESVLPDSLVGSIGRQYLVPHFRRGDFAGGIVAAVAAITEIISPGMTGGRGGEATVTSAGETASGAKENRVSLIFTILFIIIGLGAFAFFIPRLIKRASGGVWFAGGGYDSGGWSSGGGDSDSGFSGGGGDFGGGGASGDW